MRHVFYFMLVFFGFMIRGEAATISYETNHIGGNRWEYSYTVSNGALSGNIEELSIYFAGSEYSNLAVGHTPSGWDVVVNQPDTVLPSDGFYDSLALVSGIAPKTALKGFSVSFNFLGSGIPGNQAFDILDPITFNPIDSGFTVSSVPLPSALSMFVVGLGLLTSISLFNNRWFRLVAA
ncbi:hypothetical protein [Methyloglobulus sp.]|uniref:hypothetical protein n=1 Tax=Methyloglobulus sp. TaxID=2518622 RepID=UPI0032B780C9